MNNNSELKVITKVDTLNNVKRKVAVLEYNNFDIEYVMGANFLNGTHMAKATGKEIKNWLQNVQAAELAYTLAEEKSVEGFPATLKWNELTTKEKIKIAKENNYWGFIKIRQGGDSNFQGTYLYRDIAIQFAQWCNPKFGIWVSRQIIKLVTEGTVKLADPDYINFCKYKQLIQGIPQEISGEIDLSYRIKSFVDICSDTEHFIIESPILNTINKSTKVRRIDFIKKNPRNIVAFELKNHKITSNDITDTIGTKSYFKLCREHFNKPVKFVFLSPLGITEEAQTLIDLMPKVSYQSISDFCKNYYIKALNNKWQYNKVHLTNIVLSDIYRNLFDTNFINLLEEKKTAI